MNQAATQKIIAVKQLNAGATVQIRGRGEGRVIAKIGSGHSLEDLDIPASIARQVPSLIDRPDLTSPLTRALVSLETGGLAIGQWTNMTVVSNPAVPEIIFEPQTHEIGDYVSWQPHGSNGPKRFGQVVAVILPGEKLKDGLAREGVDMGSYTGIGRLGLNRARKQISYVVRGRVHSRLSDELIHPAVELVPMTVKEKLAFAAG